MPPPRPPEPHDPLRRLTPRDRLLLSWLAEHQVLSTPQISRALFPTGRAARLRLTLLHRIGALHRFTDATTVAGRHYLYVLGPLGAVLHPDPYPGHHATGRPARSHRDRLHRIIGSPTLAHQLGVNDLFTGLYAHTRAHPGSRLDRWWSEHHTAAAHPAAPLTGIRPDAHGIWTVDGVSVPFFLEHDTGTEPLTRVLAKLPAYHRAANLGHPELLLIRVPTHRRRTNLLHAIADTTESPGRSGLVVAVAVHTDPPAAPAWTTAGSPAPPGRALHQLRDTS
jgi:hypothetical protein